MGYVFGIDLGTTYSCIAYLDDYGKPVVLRNSDGANTTPSVVMMESEENIIVGEEAKRAVEMDPDKTVQFIKRKIGRDDDTVTVNGMQYSATEVSAYILKKLVLDANAALRQDGILKEGEEIRDVVITCPAYFGMSERQATKTAGELAGLNVLSIINEPTAAALSYGALSGGQNETVLVYDLGGGTFDITVINIQKNEITVVCTGGDDTLGGKNWDEALMDYVIARYEEETGTDLSEDMDAMAALYVDVEIWKKALTSRESVKIVVNGPSGRFQEALTREQYEDLTRSLLNRTKNLLDDVLDTAARKGYPLKAIDKILLVGGSSRMPQVARMIERDYCKTPMLQDPDESVAKGAAIFAAREKDFKVFMEERAREAGVSAEMLAEEDLRRGGALEQEFGKLSVGRRGSGKLAIRNVLSRSYGIKTLNTGSTDAFHITNMVLCNMPLPAQITREFMTAGKDQTKICLEIFESRRMEEYIPFEEFEDQAPLTSIEMKFKRAVPQNTTLAVRFVIDNSGLLHVTAEEMYAHSMLDTTFRLGSQMTVREKEKAALRLRSATVE